MARKPAKIASQQREEGTKKTCGECGSIMEMTRMMRDAGPSGMFWVCSNYKCASIVSKTGVTLKPLALS